jgi:hypothetical protein
MDDPSGVPAAGLQHIMFATPVDLLMQVFVWLLPVQVPGAAGQSAVAAAAAAAAVRGSAAAGLMGGEEPVFEQEDVATAAAAAQAEVRA